MNHLFHDTNMSLLKFQRNIFLACTLLLGVSLIIVSLFLFWKSERTIVVPATVEKEFWVDSHSVSPTYLEQYGYFLGQLILTKSPQSASTQRNTVLRHTDPSFSSLLQKKLFDEEQDLLKKGTSYVFFPIEIRVDPSALKVLLIGDRTFFLSGKAISTERESYLLSFSYQGSRLLLKEIKAEGPK